MHTDRLVGKWDRFGSDARRTWDRLTDEELDQIKGNMGQLVGLVQQKYDYTKDQAQQEVTRFMDSHNGKAYQIARRLPGDMDHEVKRHPWAAVATALGLGMALGFLVKPGHASAAESQVE